PLLCAEFPSHARGFGRYRTLLRSHAVDGVLELEDLAPDLNGDFLGQVAALHRGRYLGNVADVRGQVGGELVNLQRQVLPGAGCAADARLSAQPSLGTDHTRHAGDLTGEGVQLIHHRVDGVLQLRDLATDIDRDLLGEVALLDCRRYLGNVAHLGGVGAAQGGNVVGEILPAARDALHLGLAAQLALGTDLPCDAGDLAGEGVELIDHDIDGVLQLQDLALNLDRDLLGQVALLDRRRDVGDIAHLGGKVARHEVDVVGQVFPDAADAAHLGLAAQLALGTHLV